MLVNKYCPDYYNEGGIEVIDFIEAYQLDFSLGNVIKYVARAGFKKNETKKEALLKAFDYLQHAIDMCEAEEAVSNIKGEILHD